MIYRAATLAALLTLSACSPAPATGQDVSQQPQPTLPQTDIRVGEIKLRVEVADSDPERRAGLAYRGDLASGRGMLFVYQEDTPLFFTMRETLIPLSIAFADAHGKIISIQQMTPRSQALYSPGEPGRYALEVPQGWFKDNGINVGDVLSLLPH